MISKKINIHLSLTIICMLFIHSLPFTYAAEPMQNISQEKSLKADEFYANAIDQKKDNPEKALVTFHKVLRYNPFHIQAMFQIASIQYKQDRLMAAESTLLNLLKFNLSDETPENRALIYALTGDILVKQGSAVEAKKYTEMSLALHTELKNTRQMMLAHHNLSLIYRNTEDYKRAESEVKKAITLSREIKDHKILRSLTLEEAEIAMAQKSFDKAENIMLKIIKLDQGDSNNFAVAMGYTNLAVVMRAAKQYDKAKKYIAQAKTIGVVIKNPDIIKRADKLIDEIKKLESKK